MLKPINPKSVKPKSSAEGRPAKTSRSQGNKKALSKESDQVSGLSSYESIKNQEQLSLFGKMSAAHYGTDLEKFSGAYPKSGVMQNGKLLAQEVLERHILESESFSLPTPQAYSSGQSRRPGQTKLDGKLRSLLPTPSVCGNHNRKGASKTSGDGLVTALQKLLPTPTAADATMGAIINDATVIVYTKNGTPRKVSNQGVNGSLGLARYIALLPTPTAHLAKEAGAPSEALRNQPTLHHILGLAPGQVLSPLFVEWMQGFPIGWTDLRL